ncbi:hypothetical protein D1872_317840 [compost metagenome]
MHHREAPAEQLEHLHLVSFPLPIRPDSGFPAVTGNLPTCRYPEDVLARNEALALFTSDNLTTLAFFY